ncbi:GNAT family N-acetyltransferase [Agarivorans sp. 1_MG-2023]|uniref:GNAT family N-acetyltransferase n=1 Tax=Agarivorans sp. 1_MG-2023 TaxID=3062634 RepID=UPI0026E37883|nr:GNAT family N-acetyltransferase [Agarivorans sp. 1_MG-2023]MDO6765100.1 GNAT family N-acetyltransferase [Agarivorans sp. 1_MG-2023]
MTERVKLQTISSELLAELLALQVGEAQQHFVKPIARVLDELSAQQTAHLILANKQVVGFFVIDAQYPYQAELPLQQSVLLRSFFVASQFQGKGYGFAAGAQLGAYVADLNPSFQHLALTVNCRNNGAQALYKKCGFVDSQKLYNGGPAGPQHLYFLDLQ